MKDGTKETSLEEFQWDPESIFEGTVKGGDVDFAEVDFEAPLSDEDIQKVFGDGVQDEEGEQKEKEHEEEEQEEEVKEEEIEEASEEDTETEEDDDPVDKDLWKSLALDLKEYGYDLGVGEGDEVDERTFYEKLSGFVGKSVEGAIDEWRSGFDEESQSFIRFVQNGGTPEEYYELVGAGTWKSYNVETDQGAEAMVRHYLENVEQADKETIDEEVEVLADAGLLDKKAQTYRRRLEAKSQKEKEERIYQAEEQRKANERANEERLEALKAASAKIDEVKGVKIDSDKVYDYLTRPVAKMGNGYVTGFQRDMQNIVTKNPEDLFLLGHLLRSGFDFGAIERAAQTKATKRTKELLKKTKEGSGRTTGRTETRPFWEVAKF